MKNVSRYISYFLSIALIIMIVPNAVSIITLLIIHDITNPLYFFIVPLIFACIAAYQLGKRVKSPFWTDFPYAYFPIILPAVYMSLIYFLGNICYGNAVLEAFLALTSMDYIACIQSGFGYAAAMIAVPIVFFALGRRKSPNNTESKESKPNFTAAAVSLMLIAGAWGAAWVCSYYHELTTITPQCHEEMLYSYNGGYGFPYENGWSSVDLRPYYVENPDNILAQPSSESTFKITDVSKMPVLDGAEAAYPVYSAFAYCCYDDIALIQSYAKSSEGKAENAPMPVKFTNTIEAYKSLVSGDVDIFFGAKPSEAQMKMAEDAGKELVLTPIGKEAFIFFVSSDNPVDGLSSEQIRDIYSGKITSWSSVGGRHIPVLAFQRPENSGSQTMMHYFMGDVPLKEPLMTEYEHSMLGVIEAVADYENKASSIGYSFRYYASMMTEYDGNDIKFLALDGFYPDEENIRSGAYPMTTSLYAVTVKDNPNEYIEPFLDFMTSALGEEIVEKTGYITLD